MKPSSLMPEMLLKRQLSSVRHGSASSAKLAYAARFRSTHQEGGPPGNSEIADSNDSPVKQPASAGVAGAVISTHAAFHLKIDQPLEFDRVLHRELAGEIVDEAVDRKAHGLALGKAALAHVIFFRHVSL